MAPLVRTGGSRHTGLAALPHRNIHPEQKTATTPAFVDMTQLYKETANPADIPSKDLTQPVFSPQLMLLVGQYRVLVGDTATEQILSNVLKAIRSA